MEQKVLKAESRSVIGKQVKALRRQGRLPAVIYGHAIQPLMISLDHKQASQILSAVTSSQLVVVEVNGKPHTSLVREKQRQPVTGSLIHVDFLEVSMTEKLRAKVVIELVGESPAVKNFDGILVQGLEQLEVEALPRDLPERITVDVAVLTEIGQAIRVSDIALSKAVEVLDDENEIIVVVTAPEGEEVTEDASVVEPEVIERSKKEEDF
ncbi:MAG: 50S ribosomal protein L25 [Anaerolineales bacterium]|jgi:large subunit ribosomal protein L25|nr:50S ribosomal protein L25 [Anaerolineales bacterium]